MRQRHTLLAELVIVHLLTFVIYEITMRIIIAKGDRGQQTNALWET